MPCTLVFGCPLLRSGRCDPVARHCAAQVMPQLHIDAVEKLQVRDLRAFLQRRAIRGILVGGGSLCQANSSLNKGRKGLADLRSIQPQLLARLVDDLSKEPLCKNIEIVAFLENVKSMPAQVLQQYNKWMKSCPVAVNAASCGWTQRKSQSDPTTFVEMGSQQGPPELSFQAPACSAPL